MAQRQNLGSHKNEWDNNFIPDSFFTLDSPVSAGPANIINLGQLASANPSLFRAPADPSLSAVQDNTLQTPFSIDNGHGTDSKLAAQSKQLVEYLLKDVKVETLDRIKNIEKDMKRLSDETKRLNDETKRLNVETKQLNKLFAEMTEACKDLGNKLWTQLMKQLEIIQRRPVVLMPYPMDDNKTAR